MEALPTRCLRGRSGANDAPCLVLQLAIAVAMLARLCAWAVRSVMASKLAALMLRDINKGLLV